MFRHFWAYFKALFRIPLPLQRNLLYLPNAPHSSFYTYQSPTSESSSVPYALITGATDGIGEAIALELASRYGFNLILHGRSPSKLEATKNKAITASMHKRGRTVDVILIVADATKAREIDWEETFVKPLEGLNVSMLINNVGMPALQGFEEPFRDFKLLSETTDKEIVALYDLNLVWTTSLTKHLLPILSNSPTRKALVVNISSVMSVIQMPYLAVYCSVKAALNALFTSLSLELRRSKSKVQVQNFIVGSVRTRRLAERPATFSNPNAEDFAKAICRVLGDGTRQGTGCFAHALLLFASSSTPAFIRDRAMIAVAEDMVKSNYGKKD
jgi:17beta-estradiol 17-dehydrogenase / very-long-chain 3-oxoacyl-CoA reductase